MSVNKAIIVGNIVRDPEFKKTEKSCYCKFTIATNEMRSKEKHTEYHNAILWGKLAEITVQMAQKGTMVYFEGKLETKEWTSSDGVKKRGTSIVGENIRFLSKLKPKENMDQTQGW